MISVGVYKEIFKILVNGNMLFFGKISVKISVIGIIRMIVI